MSGSAGMGLSEATMLVGHVLAGYSERCEALSAVIGADAKQVRFALQDSRSQNLKFDKVGAQISIRTSIATFDFGLWRFHTDTVASTKVGDQQSPECCAISATGL